MVVRKIIIFLLAIAILMPPLNVNAQTELPLTASAVVLMEQTTGRVLYSRNANVQKYPASTTKMLTALVVVQHLNLDDIVVVGQEIRSVPPDFLRVGHFEGETITVRMLLHALLIPSGNESAMVLATEVARVVENRRNIPYAQAQTIFSRLMNEKAHSLGATDSNFNNPYGFHSNSHFTTAYDMALIGRAFINNPILAEISATRTFSGDSLEGMSHPQGQVRNYSWTNTNLMLPGAPHGHPYVTGGRTGFTTPAGHSFVGTAYHNGFALVASVLYSREPDRWQDTRVLMDYGFNNFDFREVAAQGQLLDTITIENPRRGDFDTLDIYLSEGHVALLSRTEYANMRRTITFDPLLEVEHDGEGIILRAPIEEGAVVGMVVFQTGGEIIFSAQALAARYVAERTFDSDMDYYIAMVTDNIFTRRALPYWFGIFGTLFGILGIWLALSASSKARRLERWGSPTKRNRKG